jgi:hypothetical protein
VHLRKIKDTYSLILFRVPLEALIWMTGLFLLALYDPAQQEHLSICVFHHLGFKYCPGCGLGRSISYFLHADVNRSFEAHPFGIPAVAILGYRIIRLWIEYFRRLKLKYNYYGKRT